MKWTKVSRNMIISFLIVFYLIVITLIVLNSIFSSTVVKDIAMITTSFFTLIIAILLYDKFNYRKIIFERKLDLVLKLLLHLKETKIQVTYDNSIKQSSFAGVLTLSSRRIKYFQSELNGDAYIVFEMGIRQYQAEMELFRNNPFMPKEISSTLDFLIMNRLNAVQSKQKYLDENVKLSINKNPSNLINLEGWLSPHEEISFTEFTNKYLQCLTEIENWLDKHSNFKSELNI